MCICVVTKSRPLIGPNWKCFIVRVIEVDELNEGKYLMHQENKTNNESGTENQNLCSHKHNKALIFHSMVSEHGCNKWPQHSTVTAAQDYMVLLSYRAGGTPKLTYKHCR